MSNVDLSKDWNSGYEIYLPQTGETVDCVIVRTDSKYIYVVPLNKIENDCFCLCEDQVYMVYKNLGTFVDDDESGNDAFVLRIKQSVVWVPYTDEELIDLVGDWVNVKDPVVDGTRRLMVVGAYDGGVWLGGSSHDYTPEELLEKFVTGDGKPLGKIQK